MGTIVQKYGGSSVSTPAKLKTVAQRIVETRKQGHKVVVVVSAMGDTTNQLLSLAKEVSPQPHRRELDMLLTVGERISMSLLSMAIQDLGAPAVSFTGSQSGIITTNNHTNARIIKVKPTRVLQALEADQIVIIAGFQGVSEQLEITSLGRGGSDMTAVAMAAALNADFVEICSDVDGVYSTDPRLTQGAHKVGELSYEEMQDLADGGAKVLNAEAIEWAKRNQIEVHCVATNDPHRMGTVIKSNQQKTTQTIDSNIHLHPQLSAITKHPGLIRAQGSILSTDKLSKCLCQHSATDAEIYWQKNTVLNLSTAWIPLMNVHQPERLSADLYELGMDRVEDNWSWITLVGRSLLGVTRTSDITGEENQHGEGFTLVEQVTKLCHEHNINIEALSFTPSALRWAVPNTQAVLAIKLLHTHFFE